MSTASFQQWVIDFHWTYDGNPINKRISKEEAAKDNFNGAIIRIGRDKQLCNLHLENDTVSRQHAEIYFKEQQQKFFIKNFKEGNVTRVDGQILVYGEELPLEENSIIVLGEQSIEVSHIQIYEIQSTNHSSSNPHPFNPDPSPINSTLNSSPINPTLNSSPVNLNLTVSPIDPDSNKSKKHWWQETTVQAAIIAGIVALVGGSLTYYTGVETRKTEVEKQEKQFEVERRKQYSDRYNKHLEEVRKLKTEMKTKNELYKQLTLENFNCINTISVAVSFTALDEVLETRGWIGIELGQPAKVTGAATTYKDIFIYAKTNINNEDVEYKPEKTGVIRRYVKGEDFSYIKEPFLISDVENDKYSYSQKLTFYSVEFGKDSITKKVFKCSDGKLDLVDAPP